MTLGKYVKRSKLKTIKENLFSGLPEDYFGYVLNKKSKFLLSFFIWLGTITMIIFSWIMTSNLPRRWRMIGVTYAILNAFSAMIILAELIAPKRTFMFESVPSFRDYSILANIDIGLLIGLFVFGIGNLLGIVFPPQAGTTPLMQMAKKNMVLSILLFLFTIPLVEEYLFGGAAGSSLMGEIGIIPGIIATSFLFAISHVGIYGFNILNFMVSFIFRMVVTTMMVFTRGWAHGLVAHIVMNFLGIIGWVAR